MTKKKLKIAWICHFTNAEIQSMLPLWRKTGEFASWIPNSLKGFETNEDFEIHVICPHEYLRSYTRVKVRNINYYFIPAGIPVFRRHWPNFFRYDIYSGFHAFRRKVRKTIKSIQPDLVNLVGAENAYYSSAILDCYKEYPVLITIQGFISEWKNEEGLSLVREKRIEIEERILTTFRFFCGEQDSSTYISRYNPDHVFFRLYFPVNEDLAAKTKDQGKRYDCIYFGKLTKDKGVEDFVKIIAELKIIKTDIKACITGSGDSTPFRELAKQLDCENNIEFTGFIRSQKELFEYVKASRVFLMPTYKERLASTIRETMMLKVPVVSYATGGIPYINESDEHILLVDTGNYHEMAEKTGILLHDAGLREQLAEKAYKYSIHEFSLKENTARLISAYQTILNSSFN